MSLELSRSLYQRLAQFLHERTGIVLKEHKKYLIVNRLASLVGTGKRYVDFEELYEALLAGDQDLLQSFINGLTTNFSYFFRDPVHFGMLAIYLREKGIHQPSLRLWSAAASTGEEAFSAAITACNVGSLPRDTRILATDISTKVLGRAIRGVYPVEAVKAYVDAADRDRYFETVDEGYAVRQELRSLVDFRFLNLQDHYPFRKEMDVVFLRNVMIYFGTEEREQVLDKVYDVMKPGGLLFMGLSESLAGLRHPFRSYRESVFMKVR